jgi:ribosomal-protein-alanine N-acetyltransferase
MSATLRQAVPADAALMARLHGQCFTDAWGEVSFRNFLERENCLACLAASSSISSPQAFVLVQIAASECEILSLGVLPTARRSGLARALVRQAAIEAASRGAAQMFLEVADDNAAAIALYQGLGFTVFGSRRNYYRVRDGRGTDALMLRAKLPLS